MKSFGNVKFGNVEFGKIKFGKVEFCKWGGTLLVWMLLWSPVAEASHISGIRITQTGNTGLMLNIDVTAFYTTGSTETTAYLGTYYNQVPAIDWGDGATTPRYGYGTSTGIPLVATSTVVNGIPARAFRGSFSHTYASGGSYTVAANTRCCPLTTPTYTLVSGSIITTTISTVGVFGPTTFTTSFVQNTLSVTANPPAFSKAFAPSTTGLNVPSTLTFTIDNLNNTLDASGLNLTDNLPTGLVISTPANVVNTCTSGTVTATSGASTVTYTGGSVAAGATCTLSVDVEGGTAGAFDNVADLTSDFGTSNQANARLTIDPAPIFSKSFLPTRIEFGMNTTLTFVIDNSAGTVAANNLDFTDNLPSGMIVATPANAVNGCTGGTLTAVDGSNIITYTGGSVGAGAVCTISVDITVTTAGLFDNVATLNSSLGSSGVDSATASLTVPSPDLEIPTLSEVGFLLLAGTLALLALVTLRRVRERSAS